MGKRTNIVDSSVLLAAAAHELKAPVTMIATIASGLSSGLFGKLDAPVKKQLGRIELASRQLSVLAESALLADPKPSNGAVQPAPINLSQLTDEVAADLEPLLKARAHKLRFEFASGLPLLYSPPNLLYYAIYNLLHNAIIHSRPRSIITCAARRENDAICFTVKDQAPQLAGADRRHIFHLFQPTSTRAGLAGSNGLNLYLANDFARQLGGSLNHRAGKHGNHFYLRLPAIEQMRLFGESE